MKAGPLEIRAWTNQTAFGGELSSCQNANGSITTTGSAWEAWTFSAAAWNGTPPYNFSWRFSGETGIYYGARVSMNYTYPRTHPPSAEVTVTDSAGGSNSTTRVLPEPTVPNQRYPACPVFLCLTESAILALVALAAVAILVVVAVFLARRRRRGSRRNPSK